MKEKLEKFVEKYSKVYKPYSLFLNIVEKVFNNGTGAISLFRFYADKKIVLINEKFYTKGDKKKLSAFLAENEMSDWTLKFKSYGYPDWYTKTFSV